MPPTNPNCSDGPAPTVRIEHRYDDETPPSIAIVRAVAVIENVDPMDSPTDLGLTLYDHVDPAALDRLVTESPDIGAVTVDLSIHTDQHYCVRIRKDHLIVERVDGDET